jgi:hypothetical protein
LKQASGKVFVRFTVAGAAQVKSRSAVHRMNSFANGLDSLLLPVELQHVNHTASTNSRDSTPGPAANPTIAFAMSNPTPLDPITERITERVERLLLRYEELQRTNALLNEQVDVLTHERDSLRSRLSAARARVDALLERLPENASTSQP